MQIIGIKKAIQEIVSKKFDENIPFRIIHSLLRLVNNNHKNMNNRIVSKRPQLATENNDMLSIPYSITASSLNQRQSSKVTAMKISFL